MSPNSWICLHPSNATEAKLSLDNRGLAYGDGFFTTMGVIDGQILWLDYHQQRLVSHATALQLQLDSQLLLAMLKIHAKQLQQGMLKLIITRAEQEVRGYGYTPNIGGGSACEIWLKSSPMAITTARSLPLADGQFIPLQPAASAICLSSQIACLPPTLAGLKSLNRLDNVLASGELQAIKAKTLAGTIKPSIA
ncbi:MAG: aminotransferase class IV, partial [Psychrobacter sp.]|nr:aminotransferase class IV [Psychrobacter sp.]